MKKRCFVFTKDYVTGRNNLLKENGMLVTFTSPDDVKKHYMNRGGFPSGTCIYAVDFFTGESHHINKAPYNSNRVVEYDYLV